MKKDEWFLPGYNPGLSVDDWVKLLNDPEVFNKPSLEILKRLKDYGGIATCTQLANKYGRTVNFYNLNSSRLARRIINKTNCKVSRKKDGSIRLWPVLYLSRYADKEEEGTYIWKIRDELSEALDKVDLSKVSLFAGENVSCDESRYWWLNANPKEYKFSGMDVGEKVSYTLYNDDGNKRRVFKNFLNAEEGDIVICYESTPIKKIAAIGKVAEASNGEEIIFEKTEHLNNPVSYAVLKECNGLQDMEYFVSPQGSLFKLTKSEYNIIIDLVYKQNPPKYTKENFLSEVFMDSEKYDTLKYILKNKKNIILQGAPGVGKTYAAERLAYSIMGEKDSSRIELIQFHQNYSYEDFIMGFKPEQDGDGFKLTSGIFYNFCKKAEVNPENDYFFIIDEINRGNMSKIFGELLMAIEKEYRGKNITLAYSGIKFMVPSNVYIIGMMNTADRSLAMIDYALRRRFSFFEIEPGFETEGFKKYQAIINNKKFDKLVQKIIELNYVIKKDESLGTGFCIGHSYLCNQTECTDKWMEAVIDYDIIPMIREYWFDNEEKQKKWEDILHGVFQ